MWCNVDFTVSSVQMTVCLKGHPIWRSFGTEQQVIMFGKSATEEEKNAWIRRGRKKRVLSLFGAQRLRERRERLRRVRNRNFVTLLLNIIKMKFLWT